MERSLSGSGKLGYKAVLLILLILGFLSCKRSIFKHTGREYDAKLVWTLKKLEKHYANKKIRINTWDQQADAYQDLAVLNEENKLIQILTIGDSVEFSGLDLSQPDGIRAAVKIQNNIGFIPYWKIEEFEPATKFDPDLKE
ncbi:MAG: hypothetical protein EOP42_14650 [Sphingobacteriaceae bacterium]|nr:MAG: hypothetical protein EOP42_14650 [Sphingobacteriaceae bacterium]